MSTVTVCSVHALMVLVLFCLSFDNSTKLTRSKTKLLKLRSLLCVVPPPPPLGQLKQLVQKDTKLISCQKCCQRFSLFVCDLFFSGLMNLVLVNLAVELLRSTPLQRVPRCEKERI